MTSPRVTSIDAFRGFVMLLMLAEAMRLWTLHDAFPESRFWAIVAYNTEHVPWQGCSLHDLIQPAFSFLVGAALPFSIASRIARGQRFNRMLLHAMWRSVVLILLGIFLRSLERSTTYWTFEDTLTQIGLGYTFLFLLAFASLRVQAIAFVAILVGFWAAFVLYPLPPPASTTRASACRPTGRICIPASSRTSTRTRTSRGRSTRGFSTCSLAWRRSASIAAAGPRSVSFPRSRR